MDAGFAQVCLSIDLDVKWTLSSHASGHVCAECKEIIWHRGYAPCFVFDGKEGSIIGPALEGCCICAACIDDEHIARG